MTRNLSEDGVDTLTDRVNETILSVYSFRAQVVNHLLNSRLASSLPDAEELVDKAILRILVKLKKEGPIIEAGKERNYLYSTATRLALNRIRDHRIQNEKMCGQPRGSSVPAEALSVLLRSEADVLRAKIVEDAMACLGPAHREILLLRFWEDLHRSEISAQLGVAEGTVASRVFRAQEGLKKLLPPDLLASLSETDS